MFPRNSTTVFSEKVIARCLSLQKFPIVSENVTCLLTVVESPWLFPGTQLLRSDTVLKGLDPLPTDLATDVRMYCLPRSNGEPPGGNFRHVSRKCWQHDKNYHTHGGRGLLVSRRGVALRPPAIAANNATTTSVPSAGVWGRRGCGPDGDYAESPVLMPSAPAASSSSVIFRDGDYKILS